MGDRMVENWEWFVFALSDRGRCGVAGLSASDHLLDAERLSPSCVFVKGKSDQGAESATAQQNIAQ